MLKLNDAWIRDLKGQEQEKMKDLVLSNTILLDKLDEICYNIGVKKGDITSTDYDSPSWSHKQAHYNGFMECLRLIQSIVKITER